MGTNMVDYATPGWDPETAPGLFFTMDYPNEVCPDECCVGPRDSGGPTLVWANGAWRSIGLQVPRKPGHLSPIGAATALDGSISDFIRPETGFSRSLATDGSSSQGNSPPRYGRFHNIITAWPIAYSYSTRPFGMASNRPAFGSTWHKSSRSGERWSILAWTSSKRGSPSRRPVISKR